MSEIGPEFGGQAVELPACLGRGIGAAQLLHQQERGFARVVAGQYRTRGIGSQTMLTAGGMGARLGQRVRCRHCRTASDPADP